MGGLKRYTHTSSPTRTSAVLYRKDDVRVDKTTRTETQQNGVIVIIVIQKYTHVDHDRHSSVI